MKISILQENLNRGLNTVSKLITARTTLPILNNILLTAEEGKLKLTATNLEIGINLWLPAKKEKDGQFTIPAKDLTEFINTLPVGKIDLTEKQEKLYLEAGAYKASFNGMNAAEYPAVPSLKDKAVSGKITKQLELPIKDFIEAVTLVCFAAAGDETRPALTGVRINSEANKLQFVATDGYRLSLKKISLSKAADWPTLIIPSRALLEVSKIVSSHQEEEKILKIALVKDINQVIFSFNQIEVVARLIEGEYPDFQKIIPEKGESQAVLNKEDFFQAVRSASIFARKSSNIIKLIFKGSTLTIQANAQEVGENEISQEIKYQGSPTSIAFNYRFLQDFLSSFNEEELVMEISGALKPGLFKGVKNPSFLHIIMPVRLQA